MKINLAARILVACNLIDCYYLHRVPLHYGLFDYGFVGLWICCILCKKIIAHLWYTNNGKEFLIFYCTGSMFAQVHDSSEFSGLGRGAMMCEEMKTVFILRWLSPLILEPQVLWTCAFVVL